MTQPNTSLSPVGTSGPLGVKDVYLNHLNINGKYFFLSIISYGLMITKF
jgi:hypothetical protein